MQRLRQAADVVERALRHSPISRRSARSGESVRDAPLARPSIEPIAVSTWPNSSCSSREISRSVASRVAISVCATSRRSSDSEASSANSRRFERIR